MLIGTVYSEFYGFFDGLKGVSPEEAVGLSAAETLRKQFRTAYPHRPEEDLLLADTSFRAPTIKYVRERAKAGGKVYSYLFDQDFPLMGKSTRGTVRISHLCSTTQSLCQCVPLREQSSWKRKFLAL